MVVLPDCPVDFRREFSERTETIRVAEFNLEFIVEGFLASILSWTSRMRPGDTDAESRKNPNKRLRNALAPVVGMEDDRMRDGA